MTQDLLLEIGVEELPASFVAGAVDALPRLVRARLEQLRLGHGEVWASGTPRRLALIVRDVAERQPDLDEQVTGPPARVAFDAEGNPSKAALAFAGKLGVEVDSLERVQTEKGEYVAGRRREVGAATADLLPTALRQVCSEIPFKKSMRWGEGDTPFGRPVRWLLALFGDAPVPFEFAGIEAGATSQGHRFLAPDAFEVSEASKYVDLLRERHVQVSIDERRRSMAERLERAAAEVGGRLIVDEFLIEENASLVEEPYVVAGSFDVEFLELPERVILNVAKDHQRYFGVRDAGGTLLPRYLAVVGTAQKPENIRRGNDRVMRARLADAKFFYEEDLARPLGERREQLDRVVFHKRLGSVGDKVRRLERLVGLLGAELGLEPEVVKLAEHGAALAKCDLVTLMVGELPELQGDMGRAYALAQGVDSEVARVIVEHYQPRGADDPTADSAQGALLAIADRLDTLTGCFAIGLTPTGAADPLALRRAAIGLLRTLFDQRWDLSLKAAVAAAHAGFGGVKLDHDQADTAKKLATFLKDRLRGVLSEPPDVVDACVAASFDRPHDVALRAQALSAIDPEVRALAGEVFKRAANIAKDAPDGEPVAPAEVQAEVHPSESRMFEEFATLTDRLNAASGNRDYQEALGAIAQFAPVVGRFFDDVFVMVDDERIRNNRLRLMRAIHRTCSRLANFNLLAQKSPA